MAKPVIRRKRIVTKRLTAEEKEQRELTAGEKVTRQAVRYVSEHPQYPNILAAIRLGTKVSDIVDHFIERGDFQIARKTAVMYVTAFKKACPELCKPVENGTNNLVDYDHLFDGNHLVLSAEVELRKLIALQKARIAIDFSAERNINKLFSTTHKEVNALGELLVKYDNLLGKESPLNRTGLFTGTEDEVRDGLAKLQQDEAKRSVLTEAITGLLKQGISDG